MADDEEPPTEIQHGEMCPTRRPLVKPDKKPPWEDEDADSRPPPKPKLKRGQVCLWTLPPYVPPPPYVHPEAPPEPEPEPEPAQPEHGSTYSPGTTTPSSTPGKSTGSSTPGRSKTSTAGSDSAASQSGAAGRSSMYTPSSSPSFADRERAMGKGASTSKRPSGSFMAREELMGPKDTSRAVGSPPAASSAPVYTETTPIEDLWNPYKYALVRCQLERGPRRLMGMEVKNVAPNVFKVVDVVKDEAADKAGIQAGMYLLTVGGRTLKSEEHFKDIDSSNRQLFRIGAVKKRPTPLRPSNFPMPAFVQRRPGHEYHLLRVNPSDGAQVGIGVKQRGEHLTVMHVLENSAGQKAGVKNGDRVCSIDEMRVPSQDVCKTLVQQCAGNAFDMIVERLTAGAEPSPSVKAVMGKMKQLLGSVKSAKQAPKSTSPAAKATPKPTPKGKTTQSAAAKPAKH